MDHRTALIPFHPPSNTCRVEESTPENLILGLVLLLEGAWPRAAILPVICNPDAMSAIQPMGEIIADSVVDLLHRLRAPGRWASSLTEFLSARALVSTSSSPSSDPALRLVLEAIGERVQDGTYPGPVWDFCSGRALAISELGTRQDRYSAWVRNASDLVHDTRFAWSFRAARSDLDGELGDIIGCLRMIGAFDLRLLSIRTEGLDLVVELESTIREWIPVYARFWLSTARKDLHMGAVLAESLGLSEPLHVIASRLVELDRELTEGLVRHLT